MFAMIAYNQIDDTGAKLLMEALQINHTLSNLSLGILLLLCVCVRSRKQDRDEGEAGS